MKSFLSRKRLFAFTEKLSRLVSGGLSVQTSLALLEKTDMQDKKLRLSFKSLGEAIGSGTKLSVALRMSDFICAPDWYVAYITVAEECGCLKEILLHLEKILAHYAETTQKFAGAFVYPLFIVLLTALGGAVSVFWFLPTFSSLFAPENALEIQQEALRTMIFADFFLLAMFLALVFLLKKIAAVNPCVSVMKTMAFLTKNAVPTLAAVSCSFAFVEKEKKLAVALLCVRNELLDGRKISDCFGQCFMRAGYKKEGILIAENLSLSQATGNFDGFEKTASILETKNALCEKVFMACIQPILILLVSVYITLILKTAFLPYLTNFGGLV